MLSQRPSADADFALQAPVVKATARSVAAAKAPVKKAAKKK
jgi:hypothetical protein